MTTLAGRGVRPKGPSHANSGYLFVLPFLVVFVAMLVLPLVYAAYLSLFREQLIGGTVFAGLDNYTRALGDERLIGGVLRVALFFLHPGADHAGCCRWPRRWPSTVDCCASRRSSGWASSSRTRCRRSSPR